MTRSVLDQIRDELVSGTECYEVRRRRVRAASVSVLLVVALGAGAVFWNAENDGGSKVLVQPSATTTTNPVPVARGTLASLAKLPAPPGDAILPSSPVWTGHEFLFVGTAVDNAPLVALALDVETRTWHEIAPPPSGIGQNAVTVWTGAELVVCCGNGSGAAAYDPVANNWRVLADPPVHGDATAVWTGADVIVVASDGVASFDPERDRWTTLPMPYELATFNKSVWTGHDLIVWLSPATRTTHLGEMFDSSTRTWSTLLAPPESSWPAIPDIAWLDGSLVVIGGLPAPGATSERLVGARYDPTTKTWASLPEPLPEPHPAEGNLGSQVTLWTGADLLLFADSLASGWSASGALFAYDPAANSWRLVGDTKQTALRPTAMAGDRVLLERDRTYYLSDPGWRPAGERAIPRGSAVCARAQHSWQITSTPVDVSGDGLPQSGFATRARAGQELRDRGAAIIGHYGAVSAGVGVDNGRAAKQVGGAVTIASEPIATIVLALPDASKCPSAPAFYNGIPLTFLIRPTASP
jgi:hypothetical protein